MTALVKPPVPSAIWGNAGYHVPTDFGIATETVLGKVARKIAFAEGLITDFAGTVSGFDRSIKLPGASPTVSPTIRRVAEAKKRFSLVELLSDDNKLAVSGLNIRTASRAAGVTFLRSLADHHVTPKIMEDGEGDIIFLWGNPAVLMITVEDQLIHAIIKPGSSEAIYVPTVSIADGQVPTSIVRRVPSIEHAGILYL